MNREELLEVRIEDLKSLLATETRRANKADSARIHTQEWYAQHYGKLHQWARVRLPEQQKREFFNCVANGSWDFDDPTYFRTDTAEGQLVVEQTRRAEEAEAQVDDLIILLQNRPEFTITAAQVAEKYGLKLSPEELKDASLFELSGDGDLAIPRPKL